MAMALRPRDSPSSMTSRYGSHALEVGLRPGCRSAPGVGDRVAFRPQGRWPPLWPVLPPWPDSGPIRPARRTAIPGRLQVPAGRFPPDARGLLNPPQRPAQPAQGNHLLFLFFAQDIAHVDGAYSPVRVNVLAQLSHWPVFRWPPMAGFGWPPRRNGAIQLGEKSPNRRSDWGIR